MISKLMNFGLFATFAVIAVQPVMGADLGKPYAALCGKDYSTAVTLLGGTLKTEPRNSTARRYLAAAFAGLQQPERALVELRAAQDVDGVQPCDAGIEFRARVCIARTFIAKGQMDNARKMYELLFATKPTGKDALELRALSQELNQSKPASEVAPPAPTTPTTVTLKG
jgi:hypothetical protein